MRYAIAFIAPLVAAGLLLKLMMSLMPTGDRHAAAAPQALAAAEKPARPPGAVPYRAEQ